MAWNWRTLPIKFASRLKQPRSLPSYVGIQIAYWFKWRKVPFLPISLDIEPNNNCNFKCDHCQVTHWFKETVHLDEVRFHRIMDQFPHLTSVKLQGMGEPLLNKQLIPMLKSGEKRGLAMRFFSNGSVANKRILEELVQLERTSITFSIDGATEAVFQQMRAGSKFERVIENVRGLVHIRGNSKMPMIAAWTVVTTKNLHELAEIVRLASELGLDRITIQPFISDWGKSDMKEHADNVRVDRDLGPLSDALAEASQVALECQVELQVNYGDFYSMKRICKWPWTSAYIASNGDVVPCCMIADSDVVNMGNVFEKDFSELWNSNDYQAFRESHRTGNIPDYCRNCYVDAA